MTPTSSIRRGKSSRKGLKPLDPSLTSSTPTETPPGSTKASSIPSTPNASSSRTGPHDLLSPLANSSTFDLKSPLARQRTVPLAAAKAPQLPQLTNNWSSPGFLPKHKIPDGPKPVPPKPGPVYGLARSLTLAELNQPGAKLPTMRSSIDALSTPAGPSTVHMSFSVDIGGGGSGSGGGGGVNMAGFDFNTGGGRHGEGGEDEDGDGDEEEFEVQVGDLFMLKARDIYIQSKMPFFTVQVIEQVDGVMMAHGVAEMSNEMAELMLREESEAEAEAREAAAAAAAAAEAAAREAAGDPKEKIAAFLTSYEDDHGNKIVLTTSETHAHTAEEKKFAERIDEARDLSPDHRAGHHRASFDGEGEEATDGAGAATRFEDLSDGHSKRMSMACDVLCDPGQCEWLMNVDEPEAGKGIDSRPPSSRPDTREARVRREQSRGGQRVKVTRATETKYFGSESNGFDARNGFFQRFHRVGGPQDDYYDTSEEKQGAGEGAGEGESESEEEEARPGTANSRYLKSTSEAGLTPWPLLTKCQNLRNPTLNLRHLSMGPEFASSLAKGLHTLDFLKVVDLSGNRLATKPACDLIKALRNHQLQTLVLDQNQVRRPSYPYNNISKSNNDNTSHGHAYTASHSSTLRVAIPFHSTIPFHLTSMPRGHFTPCEPTLLQIGAKGMEAVVSLLENSDSLVGLGLAENQLNDKALLPLIRCLVENKTLLSLRLSKNNLGPATAKELAAMLRFNNKLQHLHASWNSFRDEGARAVVEAMAENDQLRTLDLEMTGLGPAVGGSLAKVLSETTVLTVLNVSKNRITTSNVLEMVEALRQNAVAPLLKVEIEDNNVDEEAKAKLLNQVAVHALNPLNSSPLRLLSNHSNITDLDDEDPDKEWIELHSDPLMAEIEGKLKAKGRR